MTTRLSLRKGKAEQRLIKVVESPYLGERRRQQRTHSGQRCREQARLAPLA